MLDCYCRKYRPNLAAYLDVFRKMKLGEAIGAAGKKCPCCGMCHPHQRHLANYVIDNFIAKLKELSTRIAKAKDFEELHKIIEGARIPGIGSVTLYDAALRIGARISILPEKIVYLHGHATIPDGRRSGKVEISSFVPLFAEYGLKAYEIEEFLCCFHSPLEKHGITVVGNRRKQRAKIDR